MHPVRTMAAGTAALALLITPPLILSRWEWPVGEEVTGTYLWLSLLSGTLPTTVLYALALVVLWGLWAVFAILVTADVIAVLRGHLPRIGLVRVAVTGLAGGSVAVSAPAVAAVSAPADSTPTTGTPDADTAPTQGEPAHLLERTRVLAGFGLDSAEPGPSMVDELGPTVQLLQLFGDRNTPITVTGHTDASGPDDHNQVLSEQRAQAIAALLTEQLGQEWEITVEGAGSRWPRDHPDLGAAADRRVEITYTLSTGRQAPPQNIEPAQNDTATVEPEPRESGMAVPLMALAAGAVAGGAAGAVIGRRTAPGHCVPPGLADTPRQAEENEEQQEAEPPEGAIGNPVQVSRHTNGVLFTPEGHLRIADTLAIDPTTGPAFTGEYAAAVFSSILDRALDDPAVHVITPAPLMAAVGASPRAGGERLRVLPDLASALTEAELSYVTGDESTLLLVEAPTTPVLADRLTALTSHEDGDIRALALGEGGGSSPRVHCDSLDTIRITAADGTTATYTDLRLLHRITPAAAHGAVEEPPEAEEPDTLDSVDEDPAPEPRPEANTEPEPMSRIQVRLLAPQPVITYNGQDIGVTMRASARRLLAFLALHPAGVSTDLLTDALFPDTSETKAKTLRNTAASSARRAARQAWGDHEREIIDVAQGRYRLRAEAVNVDIWRFSTALKAAKDTEDEAQRLTHLQVAADLCSHELLTEVDLPWIEEKRQAHRRAVADCFVGLAKAAETPGQALPWLERAREVDDLNETIYQELMRTHALLGRPDAVQRTYQALVEHLKPMRVRPSAATNKLFQEVVSAGG
ncbi:OmpA family protein [Nocardiopsis changdeensis]|uniref:OmpA family protein n=1 Tax=Nocardiopsis changdeensis TaxID=2831969 RepID=A0ABX8BGU4_9ACTN|nr:MULTISPECIES: OmpA family protein [Nocardiopsis]QUX20553.1 OmpA family protein [Nocardiopsis changdeensis]QYX36484.1 OmpA family protein [Nocardiopsis sp. MT53]